MASETKLTLEPYEAKNLLRDLIVQRTRGEHEAAFAMRYIKTTSEGRPYSGPVIDGDAATYRVDLDPEMPTISTAGERNKANFELKRHHWGAGGSFPVLIFNDHSRWVATLYRDALAPSWPDCYTAPSGLSHEIETGAERAEKTSTRETDEELVFLDAGDLFKGKMRPDYEDKKVRLSWNEQKIPRKIIDDKKTTIHVYENGHYVETSTPFAVGWGTDRGPKMVDYVTTVLDAYVVHPEIKIPRRDMFLLNGEIVMRPDRIEFRAREVALLNLDDLRKRNLMVGMVRYRTEFEGDLLKIEEDESSFDGINMTEPLRVALEKTMKMSDEEYDMWFC